MNNKNPFKEKIKKYEWCIYTFLFIVFVIILFIISVWKLIWAVILFLMFILVFFVGSVLKAYFLKGKEFGKNQIKLIEENQLKNSQKLLRYATAVLAFLSLLTTANGMKYFVFTGSSWLSYLGSFAVQSILVVFSLLLCRFIVQISVLSWPSYIKHLVSNSLIGFFCIALIISSSFSYSYIANNAYKDSWPNDCEAIIQNYLLKTSYEINKKNEELGKVIFKSINVDANSKLNSVISKAKQENINDLNQEINDKIQNFNIETIEDNSVDIDEGLLASTYPQYSSDVEFLCTEYNQTYQKGYQDSVAIYNEVINTISEWKNSTPEAVDIIQQIEDKLRKIHNACSTLQTLNSTISDWKTYRLNQDISTYRSKFNASSIALIEMFGSLEDYIIELETMINNLENNDTDNLSQNLDNFLSDVYCLGINKNSGTKETELGDLLKQISTLAEAASNSDSFTSDEIKDIVSLRDDLVLYDEYINLKEELETNDFTETYQIVINNSSISENSSENKQVKNTETVSKTEWEKNRNSDFNVLYNLVKALPNVPKKDTQIIKYKNDTLENASTIQRDLLGRPTDFERAFNYFKYKFPVMAFCSAFIAIFFDLGSFFTGCFLYATEYFDVNKKNNTDDKSKNKSTEQEENEKNCNKLDS